MSTRGRRLARLLFVAFFGAPVPGALAQNLISNPAFDDGFNAWTFPDPTPSLFVGFDSIQGNQAPGAVFANVLMAPDPVDYLVVAQCVRARGGTTYDVGGSFRYPASVAAVPVGSVLVRYYSDVDCTAPLPGVADSGLSSFGSAPDTWLTQNYTRGITTT
jgi:hypothetical protein